MTTCWPIRELYSREVAVGPGTVVHGGKEVKVVLALQVRPATVWVQYLKHQGVVPVLHLNYVDRHLAR